MGRERALIHISIISIMSFWAVFLCLVPWASSQAQDQSSTLIVRGRGAILRGDQAKARQRAIASSLRRALEQAVAGRLAPGASVTHLQQLKERIYRRASQYVRSYRVLWEYPDLQQQVYRVELEVEVAMQMVTQAIARLGLSEADRETLN